MRSVFWVCVLTASVVVAACGGDEFAHDVDATVDAPSDAGVDGLNLDPMLLSETGLYSDIANRTLAPGVVGFAPRWELFSDGASKGRWIYLPLGTTIDTSDMDFWSLPQGTKVWKEFERGGRVIETRLLWKVGPSDVFDDWFAVSYQWNPANSDAVAVPAGAPDADGHNDIPSRGACQTCHDSTRNPSVLLGFSALQLDYEPEDESFLDLADLVEQDRLTNDPAPVEGGPYFPLPEDPRTVVEPAFGYLHANCGGCHNSRSALAAQVSMQLRLSTDAIAPGSWEDTPTWQSTVGIAGELGGTIVTRGDTGLSTLYERMNSNGGIRMPPIGRETIDDLGGLTLVRSWIDSL